MCEVQMRPARVSAPMAIHPLLQPSRPSACRGVPRELARVRPPRGGQRPRDGLSPCRPYNSPCQGPGPRGGHFLFLGDRMSVRQPRMQHAHVSRRRALSATLPAGPTPQIPPNNARKFSKLQASVLEGIHPLGRCGGRRHQHGRVRRRAEGHLVGVCGLGGGGRRHARSRPRSTGASNTRRRSAGLAPRPRVVLGRPLPGDKAGQLP